MTKIKILLILVALLAAFSFYAASLFAAENPGATTMPARPIVELETTQGTIVVELLDDAAPKTVANFLDLAEGRKEFTDPATGAKTKRRYYDGTVFFRVLPGFMIQGGGMNGSDDVGYTFEDEISATALDLDSKPVQTNIDEIQKIARSQVFERHGVRDQTTLLAVIATVGEEALKQELQAEMMALIQLAQSVSHRKWLEHIGYSFQDALPSIPVTAGVLAMANGGPNTNGAQFFLTDGDARWLDGKHTVFGRIIEGRDIVSKIANLPRNPAMNDKPDTDVVILSVRSRVAR